MRHLTLVDRRIIEKMLLKGYSKREIADTVGCCLATIYNEFNRGKYLHSDSMLRDHVRYSADKAQKDYIFKSTAKGRPLKIGNRRDIADWIENKILIDRWSPGACLADLRRRNINLCCISTLYSYIKSGVFLHLGSNHILKYRFKSRFSFRAAKRSYPVNPWHRSISDRSVSRSDFGHWELDTVVGNRKSKSCLFVLTERKTRYELIYKLKSKTSDEVNKKLHSLFRSLGSPRKHIFKSITCDNGSEFMRLDLHIPIYFCHPYSAWERGSNENCNRIIRRYYKKGESFDNVRQSDLDKLSSWINTYPREVLSWRSAADLFCDEIQKIIL